MSKDLKEILSPNLEAAKNVILEEIKKILDDVFSIAEKKINEENKLDNES
jgi:predicted Zn-dependent peptidase